MSDEIFESENIKVTGLICRESAGETYPFVLSFVKTKKSPDVIKSGDTNERIGQGSAFIDYTDVRFQITASNISQEDEYYAVFRREDLPKSFRRRAGIEDNGRQEVLLRLNEIAHQAVKESVTRLKQFRIESAAQDSLEHAKNYNPLELPEREAATAIALAYDFGFHCPDAVSLIYAPNVEPPKRQCQASGETPRLTELVEKHVTVNELREIALETNAEKISVSTFSSGGWRFNSGGLTRIARLAIEREDALRQKYSISNEITQNR